MSDYRVAVVFYSMLFKMIFWKEGYNMGKKNFKEEFKEDFKKSASFFGIHSVGDFFRVGFNWALGFIKAIFKFMS